MRTKLAAFALALFVIPVAGAAVGMKATLKAPAAEPKVNVKWWYSIKATDLQGKPIRARLTAQIVDPNDTVHPIEYGPTKKPIVNWPFKGTFRDYLIFPSSARLANLLGGLTLRWTVKAKIGGKTYTRVLKRKVKPV
jgi:hypothetical protein